jgi:predicted N-acetyltransferase YhbS
VLACAACRGYDARDMQFTIEHLFEHPHHRMAVATLIHEEFWTNVAGASSERMATRLARADSANRLPLSMLALADGQPVGAINLVENDDEQHPEWAPWLAGLVVAQPWRGQGVGSVLVNTLLEQARRLGFERVYFGTDGPGFYQRLGAVVHQQPREGFWFMRFELGVG